MHPEENDAMFELLSQQTDQLIEDYVQAKLQYDMDGKAELELRCIKLSLLLHKLMLRSQGDVFRTRVCWRMQQIAVMIWSDEPGFAIHGRDRSLGGRIFQSVIEKQYCEQLRAVLNSVPKQPGTAVLAKSAQCYSLGVVHAINNNLRSSKTLLEPRCMVTRDEVRRNRERYERQRDEIEREIERPK